MENTKYNRLKSDCLTAIAKGNVAKCIDMLRENLVDISIHDREFITLSGQYNKTEREYKNGLISRDMYLQEYAKLVERALNYVTELPEEDVTLLNRIHDRILVIACKNSPTDWEGIFNEAYFSYVCIIKYNDEVPESFKSPDVIVFDDLECNLRNTTAMFNYIKNMRMAHILYVGEENPLKDDYPEAYKRCANANSIITIYARLRELLEFRKIFSNNEK